MELVHPLVIRLQLAPFPKQRPRFHNGRTLTAKKTRAWERDCQIALRDAYRSVPILEPLSVSLVFCFKRPKTVKRTYHCKKPDIDNLQKSVLDAANGILWKDDGQIAKLNSIKVYGVISMIAIQVSYMQIDTLLSLRESGIPVDMLASNPDVAR